MNKMKMLLDAREHLALQFAKLEAKQLDYEDPHFDPMHVRSDYVVWDLNDSELANIAVPHEHDQLSYNINKVERALERLRAVNAVIDLQTEFATRDISKRSKVRAAIEADTKTFDRLGKEFETARLKLEKTRLVTIEALGGYINKFHAVLERNLKIANNQSPQPKDKIPDSELVEAIFKARAQYATVTMEDMLIDFKKVEVIHEKVLVIYKAADENILKPANAMPLIRAYLGESGLLLEKLAIDKEAVSKFTTKLMKCGEGVFGERFTVTRYTALPLSP